GGQSHTYAFSSRKLSEPLPAPPPPPRPQPMQQLQPVYQNQRKNSLPVDRGTGRSASLNRVSTSIGDLSGQPRLAGRPEGIRVANTLDNRQNCSLHNLHVHRSVDDIPHMAYPPMAYPCAQHHHHFHQPGHCGGYHPWTTSSLNNSIDDMRYDYDSDASASGPGSQMGYDRHNMANMKRCQSAVQMHTSLSAASGQCSPLPQPMCYPYPCYPYACSPCPASPLPTGMSTPGAPAHRSKSFNLGSRPSSADNLSTASSRRSRDRMSSKAKAKAQNRATTKTTGHGSGGSGGAFSAGSGSGGGGQLSDSGGRSATTSSSRQQSDFDDEEDREDFYSVSDNESTGDDGDDSPDRANTGPPGKWSCRFCTYINDNKNTICEICSKTRKTFTKKSVTRQKPVKNNDNSRRKLSQNETKAGDNGGTDCGFDDKIIREQMAIEKELIRRLENERRVDRENEKISRREEYTRPFNQIPQHITQPQQQPTPTSVQQFGHPFTERRPSYPPQYNTSGYGYPTQNSMLSQNPMQQHMNPMMNPMLNPMVNPMSQMYAANPLHNMYAFMNGSQTSLDRFGYPIGSSAGSIAGSDHNSYINPLLPQMSSRYSSCENLQSISSNTTVGDRSGHKTQMESGLQLIQLLRDADRKGYTADDVEVAINFSPDKPLEWLDENWHNMCETLLFPTEWLDENWHNMCETVMTLTNNQIVQNETKSGNKRPADWNLLSEEEARVALRGTRGNIWQSIEKCVKSKQLPKQTVANNTGTTGVADNPKTSLSLEISGMGSGKENNDSNEPLIGQSLDQINNSETKLNDYIEKPVIVEENAMNTDIVDPEPIASSSTTGAADQKQMEQLLREWKAEKQLSDRLRQQEREREKMRKILELQKRLTEFDSDLEDSSVSTGADGEDLPLDTIDTLEATDGQFIDVTDNELQLVGVEVLPINLSRKSSAGQSSDTGADRECMSDEIVESLEGREFEVVDRELNEYYSDYERLSDESDDEFDRIDARIQQKLDQNYGNRSTESRNMFENIPIESQNCIQENPIYMKASEAESEYSESTDNNTQSITQISVGKSDNNKNNSENSSNIKPLAQQKNSAEKSRKQLKKQNSAEKRDSVKSNKQSKQEYSANIANESNDKQVIKEIDSDVKNQTIDRKKLLKEIDNSMRQSLEEIEQMEESIGNLSSDPKTTISDIQNILDTHLQPNIKQSKNSPINRLLYDESFGWARTDYECELCCIIYPIDELVAMIACTHSACRQCLQKYLCVQIVLRKIFLRSVFSLTYILYMM
ncbi:unnamed protein product, partial [Oppiella nova]